MGRNKNSIMRKVLYHIWRNHPRGVSYNYLFEKLPSLSKKRIYKAVFNLKGYGNSVTEKIDGTTYIFQKESSKVINEKLLVEAGLV